MRFISDLKVEEKVVEHYLCKSKQSLKTQAGKNYLSIVLQDKTGTINGKVWELNKQIQSFEEGDFIKIDAIVNSYRNENQLSIRQIRKSSEGEYDPSDYIPVTDKDINLLYEQLVALISTIKNTHMSQLLSNIYINNKEIVKIFKSHSAAKTMHHNYLGGLIEHTISVAQICDFLASQYDYINRDLLITSAFLHDIGKIYELSPFPENDYTDDGNLLGHIVMGVEFINSEASKIDGFPHKLLSLLKHSILSHHGIYEYGSPKRPKIMEAFLLHHADSIDAKIKIYHDVIKDNKTASNWAGYNKTMEHNIRNSNF
ncbi:MAG: HD domain-containing protein [bacterium]